MEYNNRVICGIFHVRTNFYENLEYVLGNLTSPLRKLLEIFRKHVTLNLGLPKFFVI